MPLQNFVARRLPAISAAWLNAVDTLKFTIFADSSTKAAARTALTSDAAMEVVNGGTGTRGGVADAPGWLVFLTSFFPVIWQLINPRTAAEVTAGVTPSDYSFPAGNICRYGAVAGGTNCAPAITSCWQQFAAGGADGFIPVGIFYITTTVTITSRFVLRGSGKFKSIIYGSGFAVDATMISLDGTTGVSDCSEFSSFMLQSNNVQPRGFTAYQVTKSLFKDIFFYDLYRGLVGDLCYLDTFLNISTFNISQQSWLLGAECNNCTFICVEGRSTNSHGMEINGNCAGLSFVGYNGEGILGANKAAIYFAPATGKKIVGISLTGCYFEQTKGHALQFNGADASSVQGVSCTGCQFYGGHVNFFSSTAGQAQYGINLHNIEGFEFISNTFIDWETSAFLRDGTELNGRVWNNTTAAVTAAPVVGALTSSSNLFSASVDVQNNFAGRKIQYMSSIPTTGSYTAGDLVHKIGGYTIDANSMVLVGWGRITTGSGHVVGTDWARLYSSHVSPAV